MNDSFIDDAIVGTQEGEPCPGQGRTAEIATFRACTSTLTWRIWRRHRVGLILVPFGYFGLIVALIAIAVTDQKIVNGTRGMTSVATTQFGARPGHLAVAVGLAVLLVPGLIALQVAGMVANGVRSVIGGERSLGSMELMCASPVSRQVLLASILAAPTLIGLFEWLLLAAPLTAATLIVVKMAHLHLTHVGSSLLPLMLAPLPLSLLGGVLVLAAAVWRPRLTDQSAGPANNSLRLLGTAPAMVMLLLVVFHSQAGVVDLVAGAAVVAVVGCLAVVSVLWRVFSPEKVLTP